MDKKPQEKSLCEAITLLRRVALEMEQPVAHASARMDEDTFEEHQPKPLDSNGPPVTVLLGQKGHPGAEMSVNPLARPQPLKGSLSQLDYIPMNLRTKTPEDREKYYSLSVGWPDYGCFEVVNKTHHTRTGLVFRVLNGNIPGLSHEADTIRLGYIPYDMIPKFFYENEGSMKKWAIERVVKSIRRCGLNLAEHPKLTLDHWATKITVGCITPLARAAMGPESEVGLWILHYPELWMPLRGRVYEDGSAEIFLVINYTVHLINVAQRLRNPEGGWQATDNSLTPVRRPDGPAEKRSRPNYQRPPGNQFASSQQVQETLDSVKMLNRQVGQLTQMVQVPQYPDLPKSQLSPGGPTPWYQSEAEIPSFAR